MRDFLVLSLFMIVVVCASIGCERLRTEVAPLEGGSTLSLTLSATDDTGYDQRDGYTNLGEDGFVEFVLENTEVFQMGDIVSMYRDGDPEDALAWGVIGEHWYQINSAGSNAFVISVPKFEFTEGVFTLHAEYQPAGSEIAIKSSPIVITYDASAPSAVAHASEDGSVYAVDADEQETFWFYKQVKSAITCNHQLFPFSSTVYAEGAMIVPSAEGWSRDDGGTKICFQISDRAGNVAYAESEIIN